MRIIISMGDPNGIGIEIMLKAIEDYDKFFEESKNVEITLAANTNTFVEYTQKINREINIENNGFHLGNRFIPILEIDSQSPVEFGKVSGKAGAVAAAAIDKSVDATINGDFDALVTMPVNKEALYLSGWKFPGHTEMLANRCHRRRPLMILSTKTLRVALLTIHSAIKDLTYEISCREIVNKCTIFHHSLIGDYGVENPKIAILGLNPHAGEHGTIGREDEEIIIPAIEKLHNRSINASGPHPADGFFAFGDYQNFDGVFAMYHDQGLIPLKILAKGGGINFTAGLPIVRTSPDHGTAFPLAGKNKAGHQSALEAIEMAVFIAKNRQNMK